MDPVPLKIWAAQFVSIEEPDASRTLSIHKSLNGAMDACTYHKESNFSASPLAWIKDRAPGLHPETYIADVNRENRYSIVRRVVEE